MACFLDSGGRVVANTIAFGAQTLCGMAVRVLSQCFVSSNRSRIQVLSWSDTEIQLVLPSGEGTLEASVEVSGGVQSTPVSYSYPPPS